MPLLKTEKYKDYYKRHRSYVKNKVDAAGKPVEFKLTFEEWLAVWVASGKLDQRGHKKGQYCMSRYNDIGHYEVGNVFIQLHSDNVREAQTGRQGYERNGEKNPFFRHRHSDESRQKIKIRRSLQVLTEESNNKRSLTMSQLRWFHNPTTKEKIRISQNATIPEGFVAGRGRKV